MYSSTLSVEICTINELFFGAGGAAAGYTPEGAAARCSHLDETGSCILRGSYSAGLGCFIPLIARRLLSR